MSRKPLSTSTRKKRPPVFTPTNKILRQKLAALARDRPEDCRLVKASRSGRVVDYTIPKSWIKIVPNRVLSDAEKMQRRNAIKKANFALDNAGRPQD
ncbi:MAG: hypothetical protein ACLR4W_08155 [Oscillospiraceae bacterium]